MVTSQLQGSSATRLSRPAVSELPSRKILGLNQQTYQRLRASLSLNLRRQVFLAVCDDLPLRDRLAAQLEFDLAKSKAEQHYPRIVSLHLDISDPSPIAHIAAWLNEFPPPVIGGKRSPMPAFQILGVEQLTRQPAVVQRLFMTNLQSVERNLPVLESSLLIWMTKPWLRSLSQSATEFWRCRTGVFEFVGEPTPVLAAVEQSTLEPNRFQSSSPSHPAWTTNVPVHQPLARDGDHRPGTRRQIHITIDPIDPKQKPPRISPAAPRAVAPPRPPGNTATIQPPVDRTTNPGQAAIESIVIEPISSEVTAKQSPVQPPNQQQVQQQVQQKIQSPAQQSTQQGQKSVRQTIQSDINTPSQQTGLPTAQAPTPTVEDLQLSTLLQQIETLKQQKASTTILANAYRTLGNFYRDRIEQGDASPQNLTTAIQAYEQVLPLLPESSSLWVDLLNDLGSLYWMLSRSPYSFDATLKYLEKGIQIYKTAVTKVDLKNPPETYALLQNNLGAAYADLSRYQEPIENLLQAIQAYQESLRARPAAADPLRYASTQNNLGTTYWNLAQYQQSTENLKAAIAAYSEALKYYRPQAEPLNYAMIQNNLGTAYWNLAQRERPQDWLMLAVSAYQIALQYRTLEVAPSAYAATQNNLGTAYWHLANHADSPETRIDYLKQAIAAYEAALQAAEHLARQQVANPAQLAALSFDLFATHNNLGLTYYQIATDAKANLEGTTQLNYLEASLKHHILAIQGWLDKPELKQTAMNCIIQTTRAFYHHRGLDGQNRALSIIPGQLLPEILPKL